MKCRYCGAEIQAGASFCVKCGQRVMRDDNQVQNGTDGQAYNSNQGQNGADAYDYNSNQQQYGQGSNQYNTNSRSSAPYQGGYDPGRQQSKKKKLVIPVMIAAVAVIAIVLLVVNFTGKITVNLNKYMTITTRETGYDGYGTVTSTFDYAAFLEDYEDKISYADGIRGSEDWALLAMDYSSAAECLIYEGYINYSFDKSSELSNGDKVTLTWSCDEETIEEYFGCKVKYSDMTYTVSDLEEIQTFDAFVDITLDCSGIAPNGTASVQNNSTDEAVSSLEFSVSPSSGLSNGDTVVVTIDEDAAASMAKNYGKVPEATSKEYTVEGMDAYVMSLSEIPEETLTKIKEQSEDVLNAHVANTFDEDEFLNSITYLGNYLLTPKDTSDLGSGYFDSPAYLYMVYKIQVHEYDQSIGLDNTVDYYTYVRFSNVMLLADGTGSVDLSDYSEASSKYEVSATTDSGTKGFYYYGYEKLDSLFSNCVTSRIDSYNYETTVSEESAS